MVRKIRLSIFALKFQDFLFNSHSCITFMSETMTIPPIWMATGSPLIKFSHKCPSGRTILNPLFRPSKNLRLMLKWLKSQEPKRVYLHPRNLLLENNLSKKKAQKVSRNLHQKHMTDRIDIWEEVEEVKPKKFLIILSPKLRSDQNLPSGSSTMLQVHSSWCRIIVKIKTKYSGSWQKKKSYGCFPIQ